MKIKKYLWILIYAVFTSWVLCGCSGLSSQTEKSAVVEQPTDKTASDKKINITYAQWSIPSTKLVEDMIESFNKSNEQNIHVEVIKVPLDRYIETLNMLNSSGQAPDVFELVKEWLTSYIHNNYIADLSGYIEEEFFRNFPDWIGDFTKSSEKENTIFSLPSTQITYRLIYNKDLFKSAGLNPETPPKTLTELKKYAKVISDSEKGKRKYGFALPMGEEWMGFVQPMEAVNCYSGINFYDFREDHYDLSVYKPWLTAIKELDENGGMFPGMGTMKSELALAQFAEGNIGMMYASSWQASMLFGQLKPKFDWGIAIPPATDETSAGKGKVAVVLAGWNAVSAATKHMEEAYKVWEYFYSDKYHSYLLRNGSSIPLINITDTDRNYMIDTTRFSSFMPGNKDAVYPETPMVMDEWPRIRAYMNAISQSDMDKVLIDESSRLNTLLSDEILKNSTFEEAYPGSIYIPVDPMR